jgi:hypothetical protein
MTTIATERPASKPQDSRDRKISPRENAGDESEADYLVTNGTIHNQNLEEASDLCPNIIATENFIARVNVVTGEFSHPMCKANSCAPCAKWKVGTIEKALKVVSPDFFVTLDCVGSIWKEIKVNITRYRRLLKSSGVLVQDVSFVEPYKTTGHHIHQLVHGDHLSTEIANDCAIRAGMKHATVDPVTHHDSLAYGLKMATHKSTLLPYLEANGGRLTHSTRHFWRDGPAGPVVPGGFLNLARNHRATTSSPETDIFRYVFVR